MSDFTDELIEKCVNYCKNIWKDDTAFNLKNKETDAECSIKIEQKTMYVIFKFSDSKKDWGYNLRFLPTNIEYNNLRFKIHKGFWEQFTSIWKDVLQHMSANIDKCDKIIISGFSLGGGLSQIASYLLKADLTIPFVRPFQTIIFGAPRTGNKKFANVFQNNICHIYYNKDPVPSAVPLFLGYDDIDKVFHIKPEDIVSTKPRTYWESVTIITKIVLKYGLRLSFIDDHWKDHNLEPIIEYFKNKTTNTETDKQANTDKEALITN